MPYGRTYNTHMGDSVPQYERISLGMFCWHVVAHFMLGFHFICHLSVHGHQRLKHSNIYSARARVYKRLVYFLAWLYNYVKVEKELLDKLWLNDSNVMVGSIPLSSVYLLQKSGMWHIVPRHQSTQLQTHNNNSWLKVFHLRAATVNNVTKNTCKWRQ